MKLRTISTSFVVATALCGQAAASDIAGMWKRPNGNLVQFAPCGDGFCATSRTPPNTGKSVGKMSPAGENKFKGSLTDLSNGKTYTGKATLKGSTLAVSGCVLGGLICKTESWLKQ